MNQDYFHLLLSQAPLFATLFGVILLVYGLLFKNISITKAGLSSVFTAALLSAILYYFEIGFSGQKEVGQGAGVGLISEQEQVLRWAFWGFVGVGIASLLGLLTTSSRPARARRPKVWATITLVLSFSLLSLALWVNLGSKATSTSFGQNASANPSPNLLPE